MSAKTLIGIGVCAGVILLVVIGIAAFPNPGKKAFQREEQALGQVTSWRIMTEISKNSRPKVRRTYAAVCPDREHVLEKNQGDFSEYIRIGDDEFYRKNTYQWVQGKPGPDLFLPLPTPRPCLSTPGDPSSRPPGGSEAMRLELETEIKDGQIDKGVQKNFQGKQCQEWSVSRMIMDRMGLYFTCLNLADGLPVYSRDMTENFYMYYTWNAEVTIEAPDLTPPGTMPVNP